MAYVEQNISGQLKRIPLHPQAITYIVCDGPRFELTKETGPNVHAAFYRSKRHFVLLSLSKATVFVNECKISHLKIIREDDHLSIGGHNLTFRELTTEVLGADGPLIQGETICLVDGQPFKAGDRVVYCPACQTAHHERCWNLMKGRCASRLCDYQAPWDEPEPESK